MTTTPTEQLAAAAPRLDAFTARLEVSRTELAELRGAIAKSHEAYRTALTKAELAGESLPSREALNALRARDRRPRTASKRSRAPWPRSSASGGWRRRTCSTSKRPRSRRKRGSASS